MDDRRMIRLLFQVLAPSATVMTESQMLGALELSGIVGNPVAVKAMEFAAAQTSASAQATIIGLANTLQNLIKLNQDHKPADYAGLEAWIQQVTSSNADGPLTFGGFLKLLDSLPPKPLVPVKPGSAEGPKRG